MGKCIEIAGQKFTRLTAIERVGQNKNGCFLWLFKCDCGNEKITTTSDVISKRVQSCGCLLRKKVIDITGEKYGRLTAVRLVENGSRKWKTKWLFKCDCGNEIVLSANAARRGNTKSCGCLRREVSAAKSRDALKLAQAACVTHGYTGQRIYKTFKGMKQRCYNPLNTKFKYYGGKGITICDEWLDDPGVFIKWALSHGYNDTLTIDRKDSSKGYCPDNCQFITQAEQARRTPRVRHIEYDGETKTTLQWENKFNVYPDFISSLIRNGVPIQEAMRRAATKLPGTISQRCSSAN